MRQFDAGAPVSEALLEQIARGSYAWDLAREWVRGRDSEEDVGALLDVLRHEEKVVRHLARGLLVELGETARAALAEFLAREPEGPARQTATEALERLGRERER